MDDYLEEGWDQDVIYVGYRSVQHVLSLENLKPLQSAHLVNLLRTSCNFLSATLVYFRPAF